MFSLTPSRTFPPIPARAATVGLTCAVLAWVYWPALEDMIRRWGLDPQYSHGFLIPVFAAVVLWMRRESFACDPTVTRWWGVAAVAVAVLLRLGGAYFYFPWLDAWSLLPCLLGLSLILGGWKLLAWSWAGVALFVFMMPVPYQVELALTHPLQRLSTHASVYALQMLGHPAIAEGNVIVLGELRIGVLEACSGLGMLFTFFALSTAVALVIDRPLGDRLFIFASAVPVAILMNVARCVVTAILHVVAGSELANAVFHDVAGWLMMPLALLVLWLELKMLARLFLEPLAAGPLPVAYSPAANPPWQREGGPNAAREPVLVTVEARERLHEPSSLRHGP